MKTIDGDIEKAKSYLRGDLDYELLLKYDESGKEIKLGQWVYLSDLTNDELYNIVPRRILYVGKLEERTNKFILIDGVDEMPLERYRIGNTQNHEVQIVEQPTTSKTWTEHNLNDEVEFELTDHGKLFIQNLNSTNELYKRYPLEYIESNKKYTSSLWEFCNLFGPTFGNGFNQTVKTDIKLKKR